MAQQRRLGATPVYLTVRNAGMWSATFQADVRAAELSLAMLSWQQVDALPRYPNSIDYCLRHGLAVLVFQKQGRRVVALRGCQHDKTPTAWLPLCKGAGILLALLLPFRLKLVLRSNPVRVCDPAMQ